MPNQIHPSAIITSNVIIGNNVIIHPYVIINDEVIIADNVEIFPGAVIGREPKTNVATSRQPEFQKQIRIGKNCSIGPHAIIYYDVLIGENTLIGDGASIREQCRIGDHCLISRYVTLNYNACIGHHTKIMDSTHITGNSIIGSNVFISTLVSTTNNNSIHRSHDFNADDIQGPMIADHVTIGAGAVLLPGIKIGENSLIAAGAVVTKDVLPRTLAMGVPARIVRHFDDKTF